MRILVYAAVVLLSVLLVVYCISLKRETNHLTAETQSMRSQAKEAREALDKTTDRMLEGIRTTLPDGGEVVFRNGMYELDYSRVWEDRWREKIQAEMHEKFWRERQLRDKQDRALKATLQELAYTPWFHILTP